MNRSLPVAVAVMLLSGLGLASAPAASSVVPSWSVVPSVSPSPPSTPGSRLADVTCAGTTATCFAVGTYATGTATSATLIERWNGSTWKIVPSPNPSTASNGLQGVSCPGANSCYAVGTFSPSLGGSANTLVVHWNGSAWAHVGSSNLGAALATELNGVDCSSPTSCVAVGQTYPHGATGWRTLVEKPGSPSWSIVASPNATGEANSYLNAVSCASPPSCFAVGYTHQVPNGGTHEETLVERYS